MIKQSVKFDINELNNVIEEEMDDKFLRGLFQKWLNTDEWKPIILMNKQISKRKDYQRTLFSYIIELFTKNFSNESELTWENYCKLMHDIPYCHEKYRNSLRFFSSKFFKFASINAESKEVRTYLQKYSHLFINTEDTRNHSDNNFLRQNVRTYFPLSSFPSQMITIENGADHAVFFIKTNNEYLINLLRAFIKDAIQENEKKKSRLDLNQTYKRFSIVFFEEGILGRKINCLSHFNEHTFREQLRSLKQLLLTHNLDATHRDVSSMYSFLLKFYRYIDQTYYNENGKWLFDTQTFNRELFNLPSYQVILGEGYEILVINPLEDVPDSNKWFVLPGKGKKKIGKRIKINFEEIKNVELKEDMKMFVWYEMAHDRIENTFILVEFLNELHESLKKNELSLLKEINNKKFSNEFLFTYYSNLRMRAELSPASINIRILTIKSFLKFFQVKYNIPMLVLNQWQFLNTSFYQEGNPISSTDFVIIRDTFKERWKNEEQLLYIAFQLSMTTKIRIGEVMYLQRNCILNVNEEFGTIQYYSKTSGDRVINEVFTIDTINLIQKAIDLSHPAYEKANKDLKRFIFIGFRKHHDVGIVMHLRNRYNWEFNKIISLLYEQSTIDAEYTPYSARDTHINNAYEMVESGQISTLEVSTITGNSAKVARKHYLGRKRRIRDYLEALHEVDINEDGCVGTIVENEEQIKVLPPVQNNEGKCSSEECIKIDEEDSFYKCLTCRYFITSAERSSLFEVKIKQYKERLESSSSSSERNFYKILIELYATYLAEMYVVMEGNNE